jgi:hypothetical protein
MRKVDVNDNEFILLADPEDTPFGMLNDLRNAGRKLEDKIDQALWEGGAEEENPDRIEPFILPTIITATPVGEDKEEEKP